MPSVEVTPVPSTPKITKADSPAPPPLSVRPSSPTQVLNNFI